MKKILFSAILIFIIPKCQAKSGSGIIYTSPTPVIWNQSIQMDEIFLEDGDSVILQAVHYDMTYWNTTTYPSVIWQKDSIPIPSIATNQITVYTSGIYGYFHTNYGNTFVNIHFSVSTGIKNISDNNHSPGIYPNPCHDYTRIHFENITEGPMKIELYNETGSKMEINIDPETSTEKDLLIDTENLSAGLYYFIFRWNNKSYVRKIIKY